MWRSTSSCARPAKRAAQVLGHRRVAHREAAHVGLVDDGAVPRHAHACAAGFQSKCGSTTTHLGTKRRAVALVEAEVVVRVRRWCSRTARAPHFSSPTWARGIRIEQQLVRVEAVALRRARTGRARDSRSAVPGAEAGHEAVPDLVGVLGQRDAGDLACSPASSNRHTSTCVAWAENSAKLTPRSSAWRRAGEGILPAVFRVRTRPSGRADRVVRRGRGPAAPAPRCPPRDATFSNDCACGGRARRPVHRRVRGYLHGPRSHPVTGRGVFVNFLADRHRRGPKATRGRIPYGP